MPGLGSYLNSNSLSLDPCPNHFKPLLDRSCSDSSMLSCSTAKTLTDFDEDALNSATKFDLPRDRNGILKATVARMSYGALYRSMKTLETQDLETHVRTWKERRVASGVPENKCFLSFLMGAKKLVECCLCLKFIYPGDGISCSVHACQSVYHLKCARDKLHCTSGKKFKCPQHACFVCKRKYNLWRCMRCVLASNAECAPWPKEVLRINMPVGWAVCWRHPKDWRIEKKRSKGSVISACCTASCRSMHSRFKTKQIAIPVDNIEEVFCHLPMPYAEEEFEMEAILKEITNSKDEPPIYVHIKRNVYMVKKKRDALYVDVGCTNCRPKCGEGCVCRVQCISCSKACQCSEACTNRPFRKEKKIKTVKTEHCGWGVEAAEEISNGDFIIEYIGEVINDAICEQRLWDMKYSGVKNFYMCEIQKDFIIDASFKGNTSRFLNHSCEPNCKLEKWQVEGETRVGVFAAQSIKVGEPLTYDYRFVQFGPEVKCFCGTAKCQGYLGTKPSYCSSSKSLGKRSDNQKTGLGDISWGLKRKRQQLPASHSAS